MSALTLVPSEQPVDPFQAAQLEAVAAATIKQAGNILETSAGRVQRARNMLASAQNMKGAARANAVVEARYAVRDALADLRAVFEALQ
jgi:hypothetical protein